LISTDVIESRKVKYGIFDILIDSRVGMDSIVVAENITCDPENSFIVDLFSHAMKNAPRLVPEIKDGRQLSTKCKQPIRIHKPRD